MPKTAIIYARVSTAGQAEDELPIDSQIDACRRKAAELGVDVLREFVDAGMSGRTDDRPAFRDALAFCKGRNVDHFICWSTSRFARNHLDAGWHKRQLNKRGTTMVYVSMNLDSSTKEGWMLESVLGVIDEFYSRQVSDDTRRSMMKNAADGYFNGGNVPFGLQPASDGKRRRLAIVEDEAVVVREIFDEACAGAGVKRITLDLNARGRTRRGAPWSQNTVSNLLHNWAMCGYVVFNRRPHDSNEKNPESQWVKIRGYPAIVDEEKFIAVQNILADRAPVRGNGSPKSTHVFTGMLKCGSCGSGMMIETATGRSARYSYYNCGAAIRGTGCRARRIRADEFDPWMSDYILTRIMSIDNLRSIATDIDRAAGRWALERKAKRRAMVAELRDVEARRRKLYGLLESPGENPFNLADLKPRLLELNALARKIESSITELDMAEPPTAVDEIALTQLQEFVRDVVLHSTEPKRVRQFFAGFVEKIVIFDAEAAINYRKDRIVTANDTEKVRSDECWLPGLVLPRTARLLVMLPDRFRRAA